LKIRTGFIDKPTLRTNTGISETIGTIKDLKDGVVLVLGVAATTKSVILNIGNGLTVDGTNALWKTGNATTGHEALLPGSISKFKYAIFQQAWSGNNFGKHLRLLEKWFLLRKRTQRR
jgi:hypothetical protein